MKSKNENENEYEFSFLCSFCFSFSFLFLLSKSFYIFVNSTWPKGAIDGQLAQKCHSNFVNSTWPRGNIDGQLSLTWPRSSTAFSFANFPRDLAVPLMVNSLLIGLAPRNMAPTTSVIILGTFENFGNLGIYSNFFQQNAPFPIFQCCRM